MSYYKDLIDLRDLADEWQDLIDKQEEALADGDGDTADVLDDEIQKFHDLCGQFHWMTLEGPDDLRQMGNSYEPTLIADSYFEEYAEQLADEIGAIDRDAGWPLNFIDWGAAAEALKADYTTIYFDGDEYLIRSW